jgi:hypothetical protein
MFEQFAAALRAVSRGENTNGFKARPGQSRLIDWLLDHVESALRLCVRWPGGYGKTVGIAIAYMILRQFGRVNRLLVVVANDQQRAQFRRDFPATCRRIGLAIKGDCVWEFDKTARAVRTSMFNRCEVFVVTIQMVSATNRKSTDSLMDLLGDGNQWMLAADEYHHYAQEKDWGKSLQRVCDNVRFSLAMSATPTRDGTGTIFGDPDLVVTYREAVDQGAVKKLWLRRYHYTVKATTGDGTEVEYTTDELRQQLDNESLSEFEERVGLRYSTKYIHPMILEPLLRLQDRRAASGEPLQMLIRAMSCRHAKYICKVVQDVAPGLRVNWVGSGPNGQPDHVNAAVIEQFVPPAGQDPQLDVLVQVQKVGEGSDSVMVCEIVDLALANIDGASNQLKQFIFRGSRVVPGLDAEQQYCNVNVPSDAKLAGLEQDESLIGVSLMDWIDGDYSKAGSEPDEELPPRDGEFNPVPEDFLSIVVRRNAELTEVTDDMRGHFMKFVSGMNGCVVEAASHWDVENNPEHLEAAKRAYLVVANSHAAEMDAQSQLEQRAQKFDSEVRRLASHGAKIVSRATGVEITGKLIGKLAKKINGHLKAAIGGRARDAWLDEDFDRAGRILHAWGCASRDRVEGKGVLPWLD